MELAASKGTLIKSIDDHKKLVNINVAKDNTELKTNMTSGIIGKFITRLAPLASLASPIIFTAMIREISEVSTFIFVGRTGGATAIGAATLGNMMCNITGFSLAYGLCSALDTLISQAYGAKAYHLTGLYAQRAAVILTISSIPVAILWSQTHLILEYGLAIPHETAAIAGSWARTITLGLWPSLMFAILTKWLQGQNVVWPVVAASIASTIFNVTSNCIFRIRGASFEGVALIYALTQWFSFLFLSVTIIARKAYLKSNKMKFGMKKNMFVGNIIVGSKKGAVYHMLPADYSSRDCAEENEGSDMEIEDNGTDTESEFNMSEGSSPKNDESIRICIDLDRTKIKLESGNKNKNEIESSERLNVAIEGNIKGDKIVAKVTEEPGTEEVEEEDKENNWPAFSPEVFEGWGQFLKLGIPGALSLFLEWGSFELVASIAASLGLVPLAVHGIFASTASIFYMIPQMFHQILLFNVKRCCATLLFIMLYAICLISDIQESQFYFKVAIALATATLVGNALGAAKPDDAAKVVRDGIYVDFFYGLFAGMVLLFLLRPHWGSIYTNDKDVQSLVYKAMPVLFFYLVVDSTKCITINILRSTGRPNITVLGNTVSCLVIMLPLGRILSIRMQYGLPGLWVAMSVAWLVSTVLYLVVVLRTDWRTQVVVIKEGEIKSNSEIV